MAATSSKCLSLEPTSVSTIDVALSAFISAFHPDFKDTSIQQYQKLQKLSCQCS